MGVFGLYLMFSAFVTKVLSSPKKAAEYQLGELPCRIFQGETYRSLSYIIRNYILMYPDCDTPYYVTMLSEAKEYIIKCFQYDEFRPASHLGLASFIRIMDTISSNDPNEYLCQIKDTIMQGNELMIPVAAIVSVKDFLCLCYDFYLVDLQNGHDVFVALASKQAEDKVNNSDTVQKRFMEETENLPAVEMKLVFNVEEKAFSSIYRVTSFQAYMALEYMQMLDRNIKFRRCQNPACEKFFVAKRITAKYCGFPSPQNEQKTCKELYPQIVSHEKMTKDAITKSIRATQSRLYNVRRRHPEHLHAISDLLDQIASQKESMSEKVITGEITITDFNKWLESLNIKKERNT